MLPWNKNIIIADFFVKFEEVFPPTASFLFAQHKIVFEDEPKEWNRDKLDKLQKRAFNKTL